jgi:hypothetical protein
MRNQIIYCTRYPYVIHVELREMSMEGYQTMSNAQRNYSVMNQILPNTFWEPTECGSCNTINGFTQTIPEIRADNW